MSTVSDQVKETDKKLQDQKDSATSCSCAARSSEPVVEICCGSYEDALAAWQGTATRVELCSALYLGGLTPSVASLKLLKKNTGLKAICMLRPRGAGFYYSEAEHAQMLAEARDLLEAGADGLAFGSLLEDFRIDKKRSMELVDLCKSYGAEAVYHRAFDVTPDPYESVETLVDLGIDRILTSGQAKTADEGTELLADLVSRYGTSIEFLAGCGVNTENAAQIMKETGVSQVHSSCTRKHPDPTTVTDKISYAYYPENKPVYEAVSSWVVRKLVDVVKNCYSETAGVR